jgi:hypothetical protein
MSIKMQWNANFKKICDFEQEINTSWRWKFKSKKEKKFFLDQIAMLKKNISVTIKQHDCLQNMVENS